SVELPLSFLNSPAMVLAPADRLEMGDALAALEPPQNVRLFILAVVGNQDCDRLPDDLLFGVTVIGRVDDRRQEIARIFRFSALRDVARALSPGTAPPHQSHNFSPKE